MFELGGNTVQWNAQCSSDSKTGCSLQNRRMFFEKQEDVRCLQNWRMFFAKRRMFFGKRGMFFDKRAMFSKNGRVHHTVSGRRKVYITNHLL